MYNQKIILGGARRLPALDRMTPSDFFFFFFPRTTTGANPRDSPIYFPRENDKATLQV